MIESSLTSANRKNLQNCFSEDFPISDGDNAPKIPLQHQTFDHTHSTTIDSENEVIYFSAWPTFQTIKVQSWLNWIGFLSLLRWNDSINFCCWQIWTIEITSHTVLTQYVHTWFFSTEIFRGCLQKKSLNIYLTLFCHSVTPKWCVFVWFRRYLLCDNALWHNLQLNCSAPMWISECIFRWLRSTNVALHDWQMCAFSLEWVLVWRFSLCFSINDLWHKLHVCGFSPGCILLWDLRLGYIDVQMLFDILLHFWGFSPVWVLVWMSRWVLWVKALWHEVHGTAGLMKNHSVSVSWVDQNKTIILIRSESFM